MYKLQHFNKQTKQWSEWYKVQVGFEGDFVWDKTIDSLNVIIFSDNDLNFQIMDWVNFSNNEILTYEANGKPKNHLQFVITESKKLFTKNNKYKYTLLLEEPIAITRGIITNTLDFTNQLTKRVKVGSNYVTYKKEPYTQFTALERILKITPTNQDTYLSESYATEKSWWHRIKVLNEEFLNGIAFNDDTFNASDLFLILNKFDDFTDRTPVMYFDLEKTVNNEIAYKIKPCYILDFERKDGFDKPILDFNNLVDGKLEYEESQTIEQFADGLFSEATNLTVGTTLFHPASNLWIAPEMEVDDRDVSAPNKTEGEKQKGKWFVKTPYKIKRVINIRALDLSGELSVAYSSPPGEYPPVVSDRAIKLKVVNRDFNSDDEKVLERQQYLAYSDFETDKDSLAWYTQGDDKVYVNEYYFHDDDKTSVYQVEYEPLVDTVLYYGNGDYNVSINQIDSKVEAIKYSKFLDNYLKGTNSADITFLKKHDIFEEFENLSGSLVKRGNEEFIITKIAYKNANTKWLVAYQLNKNHTRRSLNVSADEEILTNRMIAYENLKDRRDVIKKTLQLDKANSLNIDKSVLLSALIPNQVNIDKCPQAIIFKTQSELIKENNELENYVDYFLYTFVKSVTNKQLLFNVSVDNNAEIGKKRQARVNSDSYTAGLKIWYRTKPFGDIERQIPVLYTDYFGEINKIDFGFINVDSVDFQDVDYDVITDGTPSVAYSDYVRASNLYRYFNDRPRIIENDYNELKNRSVVEFNNVNYLKNMLEKLNFTFVFEINGENMIVCDGLLKLSRLMQISDSHTLKVFGHSRNKRENDLLDENKVFEAVVTSSEIVNDEINIYFNAQQNDIESLTITTNNDKKLLILNSLSDAKKADVKLGKINIKI